MLNKLWNMKGTGLLCLTSLVLLCACSNVERMTGQEPIIDRSGVDLAVYEVDLGECRAYADEVKVGRQTATGAAVGAVVGGVLGAAVGNGATARRTAGGGAVTGTLRGTAGGLQDRQRVIRNCLLGRGYRVLN